MVYISAELEGQTVYASYTPDISCSIEARLIGLTHRLWQVRRRGYPSSTRPGSQVYLIYLVGGVKETTIIWQIPTKRVQLVVSRIVSNAEVCPAHGEAWAILPHPGR